jgi:hypothetical protein
LEPWGGTCLAWTPFFPLLAFMVGQRKWEKPIEFSSLTSSVLCMPGRVDNAF